mmetsp:Transcript_19453/g.18572  ORF Transcript_19453/g.18572 Transcript_19453/m.18572 type:complete len:214 (+) Transcript_19453:1-642(+)
MEVKGLLTLIASVISIAAGNSLSYYYESILSNDSPECFNSIAILEKNMNGIASIFDFYNSGSSLGFLSDYSECIQTPTQTKYVLIIIQGQIEDSIYLKYTGYGHYFSNMTSFLGMCLPLNCDNSDLEKLKNLTTAIAQSNGFNQKVTVAFKEDETVLDNSDDSPFKYIILFTIALLALLVLVGSLVECTQIGNKNDFFSLPVQKNTSYKQINN